VTPAFRLRPATEADFEALLDLSVRVMRADLERIGRFDPERRRARMRAGLPALQVIEGDAGPLGCIGLARDAGGLEVHSFYIEPHAQGRGLGRAVLDAALREHPGLPVRIEVLKGSPARRFWEGQGFQVTGEAAFDLLMGRPG
jgi:GNAT superfamily N-acetyltransferase